MKITFLNPSFGSGGAERTITYISSYMASLGHTVDVVSLNDEIFYRPDEMVNVISLGVDTNCKNIFERICNIVKRYARTAEYLKKSRPDVVFCMLPDVAKYILGLQKRIGFMLISSERNNPEMDGNSELKKKIFRRSQGVVFQTERAKKWYPTDIQTKGVVIHNAVGNDLVYQVDEITERKKKISAVGRLSEQKDYPTLFQAFKKVLDKHPEYTLEIFGTGPDEIKLRQLVLELGLDDKILFRGVHRDAILQIADSSCYVMSSIFEGMPNALMEAMAVGLPCVSTDCPNGPAELINNGENGLLVPVGDSDALAIAICKMLDDKMFAQRCGENAKKILDTHTVDIIAKKYLYYIQDVVNNG